MAGGGRHTEVIDLSLDDDEETTTSSTRRVAQSRPPKSPSKTFGEIRKRQRDIGSREPPPRLMGSIDLTMSPEPPEITRPSTTNSYTAKKHKSASASSSRVTTESNPREGSHSQDTQSRFLGSDHRHPSLTLGSIRRRISHEPKLRSPEPRISGEGDAKPGIAKRQRIQPPELSVLKEKRPREDDSLSHSLLQHRKRQKHEAQPLYGSRSAHEGVRRAEPSSAQQRAKFSLNEAVSGKKKSSFEFPLARQKNSDSVVDLTGDGSARKSPPPRKPPNASTARVEITRSRPEAILSTKDVGPAQVRQPSVSQEEKIVSALVEFLGPVAKEGRRTTPARTPSSIPSPKLRSMSPSKRLGTSEDRRVPSPPVRSASLHRGSEIPESLPGSPTKSDRLLDLEAPSTSSPKKGSPRKSRSAAIDSFASRTSLNKDDPSSTKPAPQLPSGDTAQGKVSLVRRSTAMQKQQNESLTGVEQSEELSLPTAKNGGGLTSPRKSNGTSSPVRRQESLKTKAAIAKSPAKQTKPRYPLSPSDTTSKENGHSREKTPKEPEREIAQPKTTNILNAPKFLGVTLNSLRQSPQDNNEESSNSPISRAPIAPVKDPLNTAEQQKSTTSHLAPSGARQSREANGEPPIGGRSDKSHHDTRQTSVHRNKQPANDLSNMAKDITGAGPGKIPGFPNQSLSNRVEQVVGHYIGEMQRDNEDWARTTLRRARLSVETRPPLDEEEPTDVFSKMKPLTLTNLTKVPASKKLGGKYVKFSTAAGKVQTKWAAPCTPISTSAEDVPSYSHYVSIKHNFLAGNDPTLQQMPYFGDDMVDQEVENALKAHYSMDIVGRDKKLLDMAKADTSAPYAEDMLKELGCAWSDVLYFLLHHDPLPGVKKASAADQALTRRSEFCEDAFRSSARWTTLVSSLPKVKQENVEKAAILCDHFQKLLKLSLWHVVRTSAYTKELLKQQQQIPEMEKLTCRVCMRFDCPYHGEVEDTGDSRSDSDEASTDGGGRSHIVETDIIHPPDVNHRSRIVFPRSLETHHGPAPIKDRRTVAYWQNGANVHLKFRPDERGPFYPCHHPGTTCTTAECSCHMNQIPCEKTCGCSLNCPTKFQGCNCASETTRSGQKLFCFESDTCACFQLGRECDPDLCGECGVCDVVDPVHKHDDRILLGRCRNANMQRGVSKHTILGDSGVHGLGLYACELIQHHEFVGQYKGEIIQKDEADRRGAVYEHQKLSYLFSLNNSQEIDSTYFGTKTRFINHASGNRANLYPRIIMVNAVHRIALYGHRKILPGEELFFDYGPQFPDDQLGGKAKKKKQQNEKQSKAAPHVRNVGLVRHFDEVEEDEDEEGNVRARPASKSKRPVERPPVMLRLKKPGPRGGVRSGVRRPSKAVLPDDDDDDDDDDDNTPSNDMVPASRGASDRDSDEMELDGYPKDFMLHNIKDNEPEGPRAAEPGDEDFEMPSEEESVSEEEEESESEHDDEDIIPRGRGRTLRKTRL